MKTFEAKYPGRCASCDDGIETGDLLSYDEDDAVIHVDCRPDTSTRKKPDEICPRCFLAKAENGACGCDDD